MTNNTTITFSVDNTSVMVSLNYNTSISEADVLNPGRYKFKTEHGAVNYMSQIFPSCCGIGIVHDVSFGNIKKGCREIFYKEFLTHLLEERKTDPTLRRSVLMMTDGVPIDEDHRKAKAEYPSIDEFCKATGWRLLYTHYNQRSNNDVVTYMLDIPLKHKVGELYSDPRK